MDIEKSVIETIRKYKLLNKKERVLVALSGGKDSIAISYLLKKLGYNVEAVHIDLSLGEFTLKAMGNMKKLCEDNGIKLHIVNLKKDLGIDLVNAKRVLNKEKKLPPCTVCGIIKRYSLNIAAKKLKADKLVTGHNLDDEAQTVLMNFLKGNIYLGVNSKPSTGTKNTKGFVQRVKPFFFTPESEILKYARKNKFPFVSCLCPDTTMTYRVTLREKFVKFISNEDKLKIVENWQKIIPSIKNRKTVVNSCVKCGEPARGQVCKTCELLSCV